MAKNLNFCFTKVKSLPSSPEPIPPQNQSHLFSNPSPSSLLITTFNTLYDDITTATSDSDTDATTPDFATAFASQRFFFSSPGRSNSIVDSSSSSSMASTSSSNINNLHVGVAVSTDSPDPYSDFRRSMQEMVEARQLHDVGENWDYLHELLMCYLSLNPKSTHKFIVGAFADLLVTLMTSPPEKGRRNNKPSLAVRGRDQETSAVRQGRAKQSFSRFR